ncbi:MAG TPA: outer-membrane lipoprotein carrier protein LolA [Candidatus Saccharimonadales bacterium]|nr:outer-membrane lipoprotein carrier protein LolA [Candidatus Saccharimonadales bacterium]
MKFGLSAVCLVLVLNVFAVTETKAQLVLNDILNRMDNNYKSLSSLNSNLKMVKHNPQLGVSDTYEGTVKFLPKTDKQLMYARIDWAKPMVENIAIIGDTYKLYRPKLGQAIAGKVSSVQKGNKVPGGTLAFLSMSKKQMKENYVVSYIGQEQVAGGTLTWHLQLTPKTPAGYKMADLWVDKDGMPIQSTVTENNGETTTIHLSGFTKNATISAKVFKLDIPKNVKIVQG